MSSKRELKDDEVVIDKLSDDLKSTNKVKTAFISFNGNGTPTIFASHIYDGITDYGTGDWGATASGSELGNNSSNYGCHVNGLSNDPSSANDWQAAIKGTYTTGPTTYTGSETRVIYGRGGLLNCAMINITAFWNLS